MATLFITEISHLTFDSSGNIMPTPSMPPAVEQNVAVGSSSTQSSPFGATTRYVMVNTDIACCLAWGSNPTAVTTAQRMGANETRFYGVLPGQIVAVIAAVD